MNERDRSLIMDFKSRMPADMVPHIRRLIVFGSRVRGGAPEDSDLDLVVLVDEKTPELERQLDDIVYDVMWDHDFKPIISLKVFSESHFSDALSKGFSFYRHVDREGVPV